MDLAAIVLRLIHILAGVFWVGAVIVYVRFLEPTADATTQAGQKFMQYLMQRQQFAFAMGGAGALTVLAGILLYLKDSSGLQLAWITTPVGIGFTIGALLGIAALVVGFLGLTPRAGRLAALGAQIESSGNPPTPEQAAELSRINHDISQLFRLNLVLLSLSLAAMATARYWEPALGFSRHLRYNPNCTAYFDPGCAVGSGRTFTRQSALHRQIVAHASYFSGGRGRDVAAHGKVLPKNSPIE